MTNPPLENVSAAPDTSPAPTSALDLAERAWRRFIAASYGRIPTHLLCSPLEEMAMRDELNMYQRRLCGYAWIAFDGELRIKNCLVVSHYSVREMTFVWDGSKSA